MNISNDQQVLALLNGVKKTAPEMTRGLATLGKGSMSDGLIALWKSGQKNGIIGTTMVFTVGIGLYVLVKNKISEQQIKREIRIVCADAPDEEQIVNAEVELPHENVPGQIEHEETYEHIAGEKEL